MANYTINHSDGTTFDIHDLEQNGPNNSSTLRQINDVSLGGGPGFNFILVRNDLTYRFTPGFQFTIVNSGANNGLYTVANSSFAANHTTIFIVEVIPSDSLPNGNIEYSIPLAETATSLLFSGRGVINYGEALIENSLHLLENFSSITPPVNPIVGQFWYKRDTDEVFRYDATLNWSSTVSIGSGALSFIDPQHPTDQVNKILEISGNDSDVGLSVKTIVDPSSGDSIFRVLDSSDNEYLRVEYDGIVSTIGSFKSLGSTLLNEFDNSLQFANNKGILSVSGASIISNLSGTTWNIETSHLTDDVLSVNDNTSSPLFVVKQNQVEVLKDFVVDSSNNILFAQLSTQNVGIGKNNPGERLDVVGNVTYSQQLLSSDGTVLLPGISFSSNSSIGFRLSAADVVLSAGGSDKVVFGNSGKISVNTIGYEALVLADNDIPNKKYVDDEIQTNLVPTSRAKLYFYGSN